MELFNAAALRGLRRSAYFPKFGENLIKTRDDITFTIISNVSEGKLNKTWNLILIVLFR